jgi:hypothetical protein
MCTSFVDRRDDLIIAMNFDNNGWEFILNTSNPNIFEIDVDIGYGKYPSFGINSHGIFVNNLFVDSNGKGLYKRKSKTRTLTSYLVADILNENVSIDALDEYLDKIEIVNGPNQSTHNMVVDNCGNVWVIEPGRGNVKNSKKDTPYFVMTNFSIINYNEGKKYTDNGFDRYNKAKNLLDNVNVLNVEKAFGILRYMKQKGEWNTDFSMVYSKKDNKVYYCYNSDFNGILEHKF